MTTLDVLLTVDEAAEYLHTSERFVRRLVEERRIAYVKVGTHVRIEPTVLSDYIAANRVAPSTIRRAA